MSSSNSAVLPQEPAQPRHYAMTRFVVKPAKKSLKNPAIRGYAEDIAIAKGRLGMTLLVMTVLVGCMLMSTAAWMTMLCLSGRFQDRVYTHWGMRKLRSVAVLSRAVIQSMSKRLTILLIVNSMVLGFIIHNAIIIRELRLNDTIRGERINELTISFSGLQIHTTGDNRCDLKGVYGYKPVLFVGDRAKVTQISLATVDICSM